MVGIQDTSSQTFRQLLGNGLRYEIPKFQRDYSWEAEQWDDLWQDILTVHEGSEPSHYMGYLVLQSTDNKKFKVIDGQQRLTTLSLLVLAVLKCVQKLVDTDDDADRNKSRIDSLRGSYIGHLDPVTLVTSNKLTLNRNNDGYYRTYLSPLADHLPSRKINASEKLMRNCFIWFHERLSKKFSTGEELAGFIDGIVDKVFFTSIIVGNELNAFKVFETLNARGVQLSSADLLKNYLFSVVDSEGSHSREIEEMESLWVRVIDKLGSERFPEFLRVYWNSRNRSVRKNELFKVLRKEVSSKKLAFQLIRELDKSADLYMALRDPLDELWRDNQEVQVRLQELKLFQVRQPFPLLMIAYEKLNQSEFVRILKACSVISFRYNIIGGLNPNLQDDVYNQVCRKIMETGRFDIGWLKEVYPKNENFCNEFASKSFKGISRNLQIIRYILAEIERHRHGKSIDPSADSYTIEHILPQNPDESWQHLTDDVIERNVYRLGNLTLLEKSLNKDAGNAGYAVKKSTYQKSNVSSTSAIPEHYGDWNEESVASRQRHMAKEAAAIWRIEGL